MTKAEREPDSAARGKLSQRFLFLKRGGRGKGGRIAERERVNAYYRVNQRALSGISRKGFVRCDACH